MPTFTLIASSTVGSGGAASIDFTSIPATYTDLCIKISARSASTGAGNLTLTINGSTANFAYKFLYGDGSAVVSTSNSTNANSINPGSDYTANTFGNVEIYFPNYAGSTNKSYTSDGVTENNATASYTVFTAGLWSNTSAITSISLGASNGNFVQHSTAYLYGVSNA